MLVKIERDVLQTQPRGLWKKGIRQCWTVSLTAHRSHLHSKLRNAPKVHVVPEATAFQISIHVLKRFSGVVPIVLLQHWWDFNRCRPFLDGHGKTCCKMRLNFERISQWSVGEALEVHIRQLQRMQVEQFIRERDMLRQVAPHWDFLWNSLIHGVWHFNVHSTCPVDAQQNASWFFGGFVCAEAGISKSNTLAIESGWAVRCDIECEVYRSFWEQNDSLKKRVSQWIRDWQVSEKISCSDPLIALIGSISPLPALAACSCAGNHTTSHDPEKLLFGCSGSYENLVPTKTWERPNIEVREGNEKPWEAFLWPTTPHSLSVQFLLFLFACLLRSNSLIALQYLTMMPGGNHVLWHT